MFPVIKKIRYNGLIQFLLATLLIGVVSYVYYTKEYEQLKDTLVDTELLNMERSEFSISGRFSSIISDIRILESFHYLFDAANDHSVEGHSKIAQMYKVILSEKPSYDQVRIIDMFGQETLRINQMKNGTSAVVPKNELQNKGNRYYFQKARPLSKGEIYISPLDLNMEHGEVEIPIKPMIRFSTPLFNSAGEKSGVLVVNYLAKELLEAFDFAHNGATQTPSIGNIMILNKEGYYLHQNDKEMLWGFMFEEKKGNSFANEFPKAWEIIKASDGNHVFNQTENGIFVHEKVTPFHELENEQNDSSFISENWILVAHIPNQLLHGFRNDLIQSITGYFFIVVFIIALFIFLRLRLVIASQSLFEANIKSLVQHSAFECIITCDLSGQITDANPAALKEWDTSIDQLVGNNISNLIDLKNNDVDSFEQIEHEELRAHHFDGTTFFAEVSVSSFATHNFKGFTIFLHNIEQRKKLHEEHVKLSSAVEHANEAILLTNAKGIIEYVNPAFERVTGYSSEELIGETPSILNSGKQSASFYKLLWETISRGDVWKGNAVDRRKDGSLFPSRITISPVKNDAGEITHYVSVQEDLTEMNALECQFLQAQKMEALGTLVGGISHDFNNSLAAISGNAWLIKKDIKGLPDAHERVLMIEKLSHQAAEMIKQLLTFSRVEGGDFHPLAINTFVKELIKFYNVALPENIRLEQVTLLEEVSINADVNLLQQVLMNILNNARDAIANASDPIIKVKLEILQVDGGFRVLHPWAENQVVCLSVMDNGVGISRENIEHIFEPFYTTKEADKGTGLGLAMAYGAIKAHGGSLEVESQLGSGATLKIYLPVLEEEHIHEAPTPVNHSIGHGESILIIDDNEPLRMSTAEMLQSLGYKVFSASTGKEAIEICKENDNIKLIVSDVVMPGMSGPETIKNICEMNKDVKVIYMSGYDLAGQAGKEIRPGDILLDKPFKIEELSRIIFGLLNQS